MLASIVKTSKPQETVQGLGQNGKQSGSGPALWPDANTRTAGVESKPKSFLVTIVEHGNAASLARVATGQTSPQDGSAGAALGGPKKPMPACNVLDMPTSAWSLMARTQAEPT